MRLALLVMGAIVVAYRLGRRNRLHVFRTDAATAQGITDWLTDPMDAVQPSDPWPPLVLRNVSLPDETLDDWLENVRVKSRFAGGPH
jgi:hypothetical protein